MHDHDKDDHGLEAPLTDRVLELPRSRHPSWRPSRPSRLPARADAEPDSLATLRAELAHWREKAIELDTAVFELRALLQSGKGFSEILAVESLLHAFMAVCRERYGATSSAVLLLDDLDPDDIFYRVRAYHGLDDFVERDGAREETLMFKIPRDQGLLWQLIHQGHVFSVRDMQRLPRFKTAFKRWSLAALRSDVWVPLVRGNDVLGLLTLGECEDGAQIPESEYAFLQEIAAVAATNIDSTVKYEKNVRILSNLRTLYDVNQQLANVNDFKALTKETLSTAVDALRAQKANLMLYNPETQMLEIKVVWGNIPKATLEAINEGRLETKAFALGEGVAGRAAKLKKPVRINDRARIEQVGRNVVYCILAAPLLHGGQVMGVMTITNKVKEVDGKLELDALGRFGEDDEQLLLSLADQAAVNLNKARLYTASITDRLTGLYNARHFEATLETELERAQQSGAPLTLALADIDNFKRFNDTYGHKAGDAVLGRVGRLLAEATRAGSTDTAFRYGGEELCMILPATEAATAAAQLEAFRASIEASTLDYEGQALRVTVSVGVATFPVHATTRKELFEAADRALYASKSAGRNRLTLADAARKAPDQPV